MNQQPQVGQPGLNSPLGGHQFHLERRLDVRAVPGGQGTYNSLVLYKEPDTGRQIYLWHVGM